MLRVNTFVVLAVVLMIINAGCMGMTSSPVLVDTYTPLDDSKSCEALLVEIEQCQKDMQGKIEKYNDKGGRNAVLGIVGAAVFWPALFFLDLNNTEETEYESLRQRYNYLVALCEERECGYELEIAPSLAEIREQRMATMESESVEGGIESLAPDNGVAF